MVCYTIRVATNDPEIIRPLAIEVGVNTIEEMAERMNWLLDRVKEHKEWANATEDLVSNSENPDLILPG